MLEGKIIGCLFFVKCKKDIPEGTKLAMEYPIEIEDLYVYGKMNDDRLVCSPLPKLDIDFPITFEPQQSVEELQDMDVVDEALEVKTIKLTPRAINDEEFQLISDYFSFLKHGKKGGATDVEKSECKVYDVSENIKKVLIFKMFISSNNEIVNTMVSQYCINEDVVYFEKDFMTTRESGNLDFDDIINNLQL